VPVIGAFVAQPMTSLRNPFSCLTTAGRTALTSVHLICTMSCTRYPAASPLPYWMSNGWERFLSVVDEVASRRAISEQPDVQLVSVRGFSPAVVFVFIIFQSDHYQPPPPPSDLPSRSSHSQCYQAGCWHSQVLRCFRRRTAVSPCPARVLSLLASQD